MSADLERVVRNKRAEMKAKAKKMAEFEKDESKSRDTTLAHNVKIEKQKMEASGKVMQEFKNKK